MTFTDGQTTSIWPARADLPAFAPLRTDIETDICIVGAGIAGLTIAYHLQRQNRSVTVISERAVGDGQTGRTSAHLVSAIDDRFYELIKMHGEKGARLAWESHASAIDTIEQITHRENIACDFARVDGYLFLAESDDPKTLDRELDAARLIGFNGVEKLPRAPLADFDTGPCLRFPGQGMFHPLKYLSALSHCIARDGGRIYCGNCVADVKGGKQPGEMCTIKTEDGRTIRSRAVVVATNTPSPIQNWMGIYTKQVSYRTYVIGARVPRGYFPKALLWDSGWPYHYIRMDSSTDPTYDILLIGGEDHRVGQFPDNAAPFLKLEQWARKRFGQIVDIPFRWSGQTQEPVDGLAYIGRAPVDGEVYVATGDSGMGLTHGTIAGMLISDLIVGKANPWTELYSPSRKPTAALGEYLVENAKSAATFKEYVTPGEISDEQELTPGSGAIIREGLHKLAVYRDDAGELHRCSAVCTHLGCIVHWNPVEKTWDCPCHGSRFGIDGNVLIGPASTGLKHVDEKVGHVQPKT